MEPGRVWAFFYGSFINLEVLAEADVRPTDVEVARLEGFDIEIRPHNRSAIEAHEMFHRIEIIEGSSTAPETVATAMAAAADAAVGPSTSRLAPSSWLDRANSRIAASTPAARPRSSA